MSDPSDFAADLKSLLGEEQVLTDPARTETYARERRDRFFTPAKMVVLPRDVAQVQALVRWAEANGAGLIPQSGNTGLVGGQVPITGDEIIVSLTRLDAVRSVDARAGVMVLETGVTVHKAQEIAEKEGALFPLALGSQGSCRVGGVLSTNAGGVNVLAYGNARELCLGVEAVVSGGRLYEGLSPLRKDNTGYDLRDLLVGAEGTLGIITAASLKLFPRPVRYETALCSIESPDDAIRLLDHLRQAGGAKLTSIELIPRMALDIQLKHGLLDRDISAGPSQWYALAEFSLFASDGEDALAGALEGALEQDIITDAAVASDEGERLRFWQMREDISESQKPEGGSIKHDVSVPVAEIPRLISEGSAAVLNQFPDVRPFPFGHVGDGNIHFNFSQPEGGDKQDFYAIEPAINAIIYEVVLRLGGSVSAEHGIGQKKRDLLKQVKHPVAYALMGDIKRALDPHGIFNPGKMLVG